MEDDASKPLRASGVSHPPLPINVCMKCDGIMCGSELLLTLACVIAQAISHHFFLSFVMYLLIGQHGIMLKYVLIGFS